MVRDLPIGAGGLLSYFTRHKTVANLLLVVLVVSGLFTLPNMRAQFFPDVIVDDISIGVRWNGAGAEDVDAGIVQLLEPVLLSIEGVTDASSLSREGSAKIKLEFEPGWDMSRQQWIRFQHSRQTLMILLLSAVTGAIESRTLLSLVQ